MRAWEVFAVLLQWLVHGQCNSHSMLHAAQTLAPRCCSSHLETPHALLPPLRRGRRGENGGRVTEWRWCWRGWRTLLACRPQPDGCMKRAPGERASAEAAPLGTSRDAAPPYGGDGHHWRAPALGCLPAVPCTAPGLSTRPLNYAEPAITAGHELHDGRGAHASLAGPPVSSTSPGIGRGCAAADAARPCHSPFPCTSPWAPPAVPAAHLGAHLASAVEGRNKRERGGTEKGFWGSNARGLAACTAERLIPPTAKRSYICTPISQRLRGPHPVERLPSPHPRPLLSSAALRGSKHSHCVPAAITATSKASAPAPGNTLNTSSGGSGGGSPPPAAGAAGAAAAAGAAEAAAAMSAADDEARAAARAEIEAAVAALTPEQRESLRAEAEEALARRLRVKVRMLPARHCWLHYVTRRMWRCSRSAPAGGRAWPGRPGHPTHIHAHP